MKYQDVVEAWNDQADEFNQWCELDEEEKINFAINMNNRKLIITVQDFGSGMSKEVQEKLFKEMITTKGKDGTGIGLFMSYSNIRAHFNGDITYSTEKGKGTIFNIILPQ